MFGGKLNSNCEPVLVKNSVIAGFGPFIYVFDKNSQQCRNQLNVGHQSNIINIQYNQNKNIILSFDTNGTLILSHIEKGINNKQFACKILTSISLLHHHKSKNTNKSVIKQSRLTFINQNQVVCHFIQNRKLHKCLIDISEKKNGKNLQLQIVNYVQIINDRQFCRILDKKEHEPINQDKSQPSSYLILLQQDYKSLYILQESMVSPKYWEYKHQQPITAAKIMPQFQTIIIGDQSGKIYLLHDYLSGKIYTQTKMQWHTGPVTALCLNGNYLYSGGQESVIVLWHLRDFSKDFLPRIGTKIQNINISETTNQIVCCTSDNSIKIVDISSDKTVKTLKTILNPQGYIIQRTIKKGNICEFKSNNLEKIVCLPSISGRLQFINTNNAQNNQFQVIKRNLISGLDKQTPAPHQITSFCFLDKSWNDMLTSIQGQNGASYLKYYRQKIGVESDYDLITRIDHPHLGSHIKCYTVNGQYITMSPQDSQIKLWKQHKQNKKSIIDRQMTVWRCYKILNHRGMKPKALNTWQGLVMIVYEGQIVIEDIKNSQNLTKIYEQRSQNPIKDGKIINQSTFSVTREDQSIEIWQWSQKVPKIKYQITENNVQNSNIYVGKTKVAIIIKLQHSLRAIIYNIKQQKFTRSILLGADSTSVTGYWYNQSEDNFIVIIDGINMISIVNKNFVEFENANSQALDNYMDQETLQTKQKINSNDIFQLNERWIMRKDIQSKGTKSNNSILSNMHLMPDSTSFLSAALKQMLY